VQDAQSIQAADARLQAFQTPRATLVVVLGICLTLYLTALVVGTAVLMTSEDGMRTLVSDFRVFWAAARLVLAGDALAAFDLARLEGEYGAPSEDWMPWLYPPGYLLLITPFGALPYAVAFLAMTLLSLAAMALAARPFAGGVTLVWAAITLAPAYLPTLIIGQNSLIWLAVLMAALAALRSGHGVLAGVLIGCLTLKPQLGVMIPFALLAAGQWRTIGAALVTTVGLALVPTLVLGAEYWPLLADRIADHGDRMIELVGELVLIVGPVHLASLLGLSTAAALAVQAGIAALCAVSVMVAWWSRRIGFDAKVAVLLIAILLSAPYLWYYEAAMMAAIGLFLVRAGILTPRWPHLLLLTLLWIGAGLQSMDIVFPLFADRYLGATIVTPVLIVSLLLCWAHVLHAVRTADGPR
jgi:arabinofuranan 3-O-arabinosyltransferase